MDNQDILKEEMYDYNDLQAQSIYLNKLLTLVIESCETFYEDIIHTEMEFKKLSIFNRSKGIKFFEITIQMHLEELKEMIIQLKNLWHDIERDLHIKNYEMLNNHLRTYTCNYAPMVQKFSHIEKYFENVPNILKKTYKDDSKYKQLQNDYKDRKEVIHQLHEGLNKLYTLLAID